jgi:hypothetical protein
MEHRDEVLGNPQNIPIHSIFGCAIGRPDQCGNRGSVAAPEEQNSRRCIFSHEAVTRRSKRRLSRIAKGL